MKKYVVYLLMVDCKLMYYGFTNNYTVRKKEHIRDVGQLMSSGDYKLLPSQTKKLSVHHRIAAFILRSNKWGTSTCRMQFSICYMTDCLEEAKEVELFLIKKAIKNKNCCNTKTNL